MAGSGEGKVEARTLMEEAEYGMFVAEVRTPRKQSGYLSRAARKRLRKERQKMLKQRAKASVEEEMHRCEGTPPLEVHFQSLDLSGSRLYGGARTPPASLIRKPTWKGWQIIPDISLAAEDSVRYEVERKQTTEVGIRDSAKSFSENQVICPLPHESEMEGESGKQHSEAPTAILSSDQSAQNKDLLPADKILSSDQSARNKNLLPADKILSSDQSARNKNLLPADKILSSDQSARNKNLLPADKILSSDQSARNKNLLPADKKKLRTEKKMDELNHMIELAVDDQKPTTEVGMGIAESQVICRQHTHEETSAEKKKLKTEREMNELKQMTAKACPKVPRSDDLFMAKQISFGRLEVDGDEMDMGKSRQQLDMEKEEMAAEEEDFAFHRSSWECRWGSNGCGSFEDMTQVSSMHLTHLTPKPSVHDGTLATTLQIFSVKLTEIKGGFDWPLSVYGVVAARDSVDHNRNLLFSRSRRRPQTIKQRDPFLRLIGPSRAILRTEPVDFEIQLKVERGEVSQDRALISATHCHTSLYPGSHTVCFENCFCKIELHMEQLVETVQATVCSIRVVKQGVRCRFGDQCRVACSTTSYSHKIIAGKIAYVANPPSGEVVLLDPGKLAMPKGSFGYLDLLRRVVSVQLKGRMEVVVQAYSSSGFSTAKGSVSLTPQGYGFSVEKFQVDDAELEISVAWSTHVEDKGDIARQGWMFESSFV